MPQITQSSQFSRSSTGNRRCTLFFFFQPFKRLRGMGGKGGGFQECVHERLSAVGRALGRQRSGAHKPVGGPSPPVVGRRLEGSPSRPPKGTRGTAAKGPPVLPPRHNAGGRGGAPPRPLTPRGRGGPGSGTRPHRRRCGTRTGPWRGPRAPSGGPQRSDTSGSSRATPARWVWWVKSVGTAFALGGAQHPQPGQGAGVPERRGGGCHNCTSFLWRGGKLHHYLHHTEWLYDAHLAEVSFALHIPYCTCRRRPVATCQTCPL